MNESTDKLAEMIFLEDQYLVKEEDDNSTSLESNEAKSIDNDQNPITDDYLSELDNATKDRIIDYFQNQIQISYSKAIDDQIKDELLNVNRQLLKLVMLLSIKKATNLDEESLDATNNESINLTNQLIHLNDSTNLESELLNSAQFIEINRLLKESIITNLIKNFQFLLNFKEVDYDFKTSLVIGNHNLIINLIDLPIKERCSQKEEDKLINCKFDKLEFDNNLLQQSLSKSSISSCLIGIGKFSKFFKEETTVSCEINCSNIQWSIVTISRIKKNKTKKLEFYLYPKNLQLPIACNVSCSFELISQKSGYDGSKMFFNHTFTQNDQGYGGAIAQDYEKLIKNNLFIKKDQLEFKVTLNIIKLVHFCPTDFYLTASNLNSSNDENQKHKSFSV